MDLPALKFLTASFIFLVNSYSKVEFIQEYEEAGIQLYHSSENKLFRSLCTHKDSVNEFQKPGVYRIPCECGLVYIGETGRNLSLRLKEHKTNCEKAELKNQQWLNTLGLMT